MSGIHVDGINVESTQLCREYIVHIAVGWASLGGSSAAELCLLVCNIYLLVIFFYYMTMA